MIRKNFIRLTALSGMYFASGNYAKNPLVTARRNSGLSASQLQEFLTSMVELKPDTVDMIIRENYPDIDVLHFSQGCRYDWITA